MQLTQIVLVLTLSLIIFVANSQCLQLHEFLNKILNSKTITTTQTNGTDLDEARGKKKTTKYLIPMLFGALLIKSIIFPLAFKAMAVMSSISVVLSTMSLIVSSLVGYGRMAAKAASPPTVKVVHEHSPSHSWAKNDNNSTGSEYAFDAVDNERDAINPYDNTYYKSYNVNY